MTLGLAPAALGQGTFVREGVAPPEEHPIDAGNYLLGATAHFSSQGSTLSHDGRTVGESDRLVEASYGVSYGYFATRGLALGLDSQYQRATQGDFTRTTASIGPSVYFFYGAPASTLYPFLSASAGYSTLTVDFDGEEGRASGFRYGASGGLVYMLARNVGVTGSLFYRNQSYDDDELTQTDDAFGFQGGLTAFIF